MWFKVDDKLWGNAKWRSATKGARALWTTAGAWCASEENDGNVPRHMLSVLDGTVREATNLCQIGLWQPTDSGWTFRNWHEYQPTREEQDRKRELEREKKARWRERAGRGANGQFVSTRVSTVDTTVDTTVDSPVSSTVESTGESTRNPTRPDPTPIHTGARGAPARAADAAESEFETLWDLYPKQVAERLARAAWKRATANTDPELIVDGLRAQLPALQGTEPKFLPNLSRWLDESRWTDKPPTAPDDDPYSHLPWVNASGDK